MELQNLSSSASSGDVYKQLNALRLYIMQLKDELETEFSNIGYENLNNDLRKRLNGVDDSIAEIATATSQVAQDVSVNYDSSTSSIDGSRINYVSIDGTKLKDLTIEEVKLKDKTISPIKLKGVVNEGEITDAEWVNINPIIDISYEDGILTYTTQEMTVLKSGIEYEPEEHTVNIEEVNNGNTSEE